MGLTDAERDALLEVAHRDLRQVVASTEAAEDLTLLQLSVLHNTYPLWRVERECNEPRRVRWVARLRYEVSPAMAATGIAQEVEASDPIALAAALAWHTYLFNCWRARTG